MEVDEIQSLQVSKFQRVSSNGSTTSTDNSSNPQKLASNRGNFELQNHVDVGVGGVGGGGGGGGVRLCGWPSSRIVRVSRASGGKDRHSKVLTSKGLRDRRVRLSVGTAIQFYDLQDRLGYDQPSKAVEWLLKAAASSIDELPSLDPPFSGGISDGISDRKVTGDGNDNVCSQAKSPACSSTSETSKGSGLSLSRSENRVKARERAREMASKKEKEKEIDSTRVSVLNQVNHMPENSTFTDLLTGGINTTTTTTTTNDYLFTRTLQPSPNLIQIPQFNNHHHHQQPPQHHHFSFLQDTFSPATGGGAGGGDSYSLNFAMTASPTGAVALGGFSRGTLQSNLQSSLLPHHHHHHLQRFQSSSIDVPTSSNLPFFIVPNATVDHYPAAGGYHLSYGGDGGGRRSDHQKEKSKN